MQLFADASVTLHDAYTAGASAMYTTTGVSYTAGAGAMHITTSAGATYTASADVIYSTTGAGEDNEHDRSEATVAVTIGTA